MKGMGAAASASFRTGMNRLLSILFPRRRASEPSQRVVWALAFALLLGGLLVPALAAKPGNVILPIEGDSLPQTPEIDRLEARLVLGADGWRVAAIQSSSSCGEAPRAALPSGKPWLVSHLRFVLSDIDADNDLDVIVVNRHSGRAQSVWRNNGTGPFERVRENRYGMQRFPEDRMSGRDRARADFALLAASGSLMRTRPSAAATLRRQGYASRPHPRTPHSSQVHASSLGRAPPSAISFA